MKISIFGMGYVGVVSGACLLQSGHDIIGIDPSDEKISALTDGNSPIEEPGVASLLAEGHRQGRFKAQSTADITIQDSDMIWICVGTPSRFDGSTDLSSLRAVAQQLSTLLSHTTRVPLIVIRSTCLPGSLAAVVEQFRDLAKESTSSRAIDIVYHPEFMREGSAVEDFFNPPRIVIGESQLGIADPLLTIYKDFNCPLFRLTLEEAAFVKYYDNTFHALKITFANELGRLAQSLGLDARRLADVFCADTKLNISTRYLRPGSAFGGSCLPKDLRAILRLASSQSVPSPMLESLLRSNDIQIDAIIQRILLYQPEVVGIVGIAFKPGTDDMRESPYVRIAKALIGEGISLKIYDPIVRSERLLGTNKTQIDIAIRSLSQLLVSSPKTLVPADLILINHNVVSVTEVQEWIDSGTRIIDTIGLARLESELTLYEGLYW